VRGTEWPSGLQRRFRRVPSPVRISTTDNLTQPQKPTGAQFEILLKPNTRVYQLTVPSPKNKIKNKQLMAIVAGLDDQ